METAALRAVFAPAEAAPEQIRAKAGKAVAKREDTTAAHYTTVG
jgi:hypothetical protein